MTDDVQSPSLSKQSLYLLTGRGIGFVFSFAIPLVVVRLLEPEVFGQYKQYFLITTTFLGIADVGLPASLFYFLPGEGRRKPLFVSGVTLVLAVISLAAAAAAWAGGSTLAGWLNAPELASVMPILGLYAGLMLVTQYAESLPVIEKHPATAGGVAFSAEFLKAACLIGGAVIGRSLSAIAWASVLYAAIRLVYLLSYAGHLYGLELLQLSWRVTKRTLRYALPFGVAGLVSTSLTYLHQYYVAAQTDPSVFAVYAIGCFNIPLTYVLYTTLADVALVRVSEYYKEDRHDDTFFLFRDVQRRLAVFFLPAFGFIAAFAEPLISVLFTERYLAAAPVLIAYSSSMILFTFADHVVLRAYDETRFILGANSLGLLASAGGVVGLYALFGLPGAALGYVVGLLTQRSVGLARIAWLLGRSWSELIPGEHLVRTTVVAGVAAVAARFAVGDLAPVTTLLFGFPAFALVYGALVWLTGVVDKKEKERIIRFCRRLTQ